MPAVAPDGPDYLLIRDLPTSERPRERLRDYGPAAVSNAELLAIVWRTGSARESVLDLAQRTLVHFGSLAEISRASLPELTSIKGIGPAKALEIQAAIELGRRTVSLNPEERLTVRSPADVANVCVPEMRHLQQEQLHVLLLNTNK